MGQRPIGAATLRTEAIEDCLLALGSEFEYDAAGTTRAVVVVRPTADGRAIQIPLLVEQHPRIGQCPIVAGRTLRTEAVEDRIPVLWRELEYYAASVSPAISGRAIQISVLIKSQPCVRIITICAVVIRAEAVEDCVPPFRRELEDDALPVDPAVLGRPIEVSFLIKDQTRKRIRPISAGVTPRTEVMEDCLLALWGQLKHDATAPVRVAAFVVSAAAVGRPVKVSLLVEYQPCSRAYPIVAVVLRAEAVKHAFAPGPCRAQQYSENHRRQQDASLREKCSG